MSPESYLRWRHLVPMLGLILLLGSPTADAHWCNNIYDAPARLVVKPERSTVFDMGTGGTDELRVWVRNNFPYLVKNAEMRILSTDFEVTISPERQDIFPGQEVAFDLSIRRTQDTDDDELHIQLRVFEDTEHTSDIKEWRGQEDPWVDQNPPEDTLRTMMSRGQAMQLHAATLADLYHEADGVEQLLAFYGRPRLMFNNDGMWGDGTWFPPRSLTNFDYLMLRAGTELAMRQSDDPAALQAMLDAMDDPEVGFRGASALLAAYLAERLGASDQVKDRIETMASTDACVKQELCSNYTYTPSDDARLMAKAALLVLGEDQHRADVTAGLEHESDVVRMACAVALGLMGEDEPVVDGLFPLVADEYGFIELYAAYLLKLVAVDRRGPSGDGQVSFYDDHGPTSEATRGCGCGAGGVPAGLLLIPLLGLWGRRRADQRAFTQRSKASKL